MTVEVPEHLALEIRKQIQEGKFASESEAIVARMQQSHDSLWMPDGPIDGLSDEEWEAEVQRRIDEHERGETNFFTLDEVRASLAASREERNAA